MTCPINMPEGLCDLCPHSKEGLCDHPYLIEMKYSEIKKTTQEEKNGKEW